MSTMWTETRLGALTAADRHQLWVNASAKNTDEARELISVMEHSGLSFLHPKGLELDSIAGRALYRIIFSQASKDAGALATDAGRPALADIEPLIISEVGAAYSDEHKATIQAASLVSRMMTVNGFDKTGKKRPMPAGSVAKSADLYKRKP